MEAHLTCSTSSASDTQRQVSPVVLDLFRKFRAMYRGKFDQQFKAAKPVDRDRAVSAALLMFDEQLAGVSRGMVVFGLRRLEEEIAADKQQGKESWPPNAIEFAVLCKPRPRDLNMPDVGDAYQDARLGSWKKHSAIGLAAVTLSADDWRRGDAFCRPRFTAAYLALVERVACGEVLPRSNAAALLPAPERPNADEVKERFDLMRAALRGKAA